jgi:hypothetical protein
VETRKLMPVGNLFQLIPQLKPNENTGIKLSVLLKKKKDHKRLWKPQWSDVDEELLKWFKQKNVLVSSLISWPKLENLPNS